MKGSLVNSLQSDIVRGYLDSGTYQTPSGLPANVPEYCDMKQKIPQGKYWYVPYAAVLCNSNSGNEFVDLFICPESERTVQPKVINNGTSGTPTPIIGKAFRGISLVDGGYGVPQSRAKGSELAVRNIVVPYGYFLRAQEMFYAGGSVDTSGMVYLEYMWVELDQCQDYE
jgi:hypothetical protein